MKLYVIRNTAVVGRNGTFMYLAAGLGGQPPEAVFAKEPARHQDAMVGSQGGYLEIGRLLGLQAYSALACDGVELVDRGLPRVINLCPRSRGQYVAELEMRKIDVLPGVQAAESKVILPAG